MMVSIENTTTPWAKISSREFDSWHSMCSYLGSFPPPLANYFVNYFSSEGDLVFDPFCGRGTTGLEARLLSRKSLSSDLNPIALALSSAKNKNLSKEEILERIEELRIKYDYALYQAEASSQPDEIHLIFHPRTLAQLCYLKRKILHSKFQVDKFIIGISLGILHGGERANGTSGYASIDMPNTFSMSPEYVRRFVQTNELNRVFHDVFSLLVEKTERMYKKHARLHKTGYVIESDVKLISKNKNLRKFRKKVKLILTSPPYLGIVNYAKQNWIRSWFLNQDIGEVSKQLDDDLNLDEWLSFSKVFISELKPFLNKSSIAVFVIGDVARSKTSIISLAREFCLMIKEYKYFKNVWCISDVIEDTDKTTRIWGDTKGSATTTDRIVILSDINPFTKKKRITGLPDLDIKYVQRQTKLFLG